MKKPTFGKMFALALAVAGSSFGVVNGQYAVTGTTAGGGNIIVGNGTPGILGPGSPLSLGGSDQVTLNIGTVATSTGVTIEFLTNNNTLINNGTISSTGNGSFIGGTAVIFSSLGDIANLDFSNVNVFDPSGNLSGETIINHGVIAGGNATGDFSGSIGGAIGGSGILILSANDLINTSLTNTGSILGGSANSVLSAPEFVVSLGGSSLLTLALNDVTNLVINNSGLLGGGSAISTGSDNIAISAGGAAIFTIAIHDINNMTIGNSGNIIGGSAIALEDEGIAGSIGGTGIFALAVNDINGVSINNSGNITGGMSSADGGFDGEGISLGGMGALFLSLDGINNFSVVNSGNIAGGTSIASGDNFALAIGGVGVLIDSSSVNNLSFSNSGHITGGSVSVSSNNNGQLIAFGGDGVLISSLNLAPLNDLISSLLSTSVTIFPDVANISNVNFVNTGTITGGSFSGGPNFLPLGATGVSFFNLSFSGTSNNQGISNVKFKNFGAISGGNGVADGSFGGDGVAFTALDLSNILSILSGSSISALGSDIPLKNIKVDNFGSIKGGNGGPGGAGGNAISFIGGDSSSNIVVNNFGTLTGGNGVGGGTAGAGVFAVTSGLTINNWGTINAGSGASLATVSGYPAVAISVEGNNNKINLNGHSEVHGTIQGVNGNGNELNLNFSGVSPLEKLHLDQELSAQGYKQGQPFTGTFTLRGVTYYVDPLVLNIRTSSYQLQGLTPNQQAVGANLDSFVVNPTGDMLNLLNTIDAGGNVPLALEQLSPQRYQIYGDIALATATFNTLEIDHRLNNLRDGSESIDTTEIGGSSDGKTSAGFSKEGKDNKNVVVPEKGPEKRWGFFAAGSGLFTNVDGHGGDLGDAGFTSAGLMMGVDGKINDNWVAGLLFNYSYTVADLDNEGSKANVETFGGGIYAGYHNAGWYGNGLATYGHNQYDSARNIIFPGINRIASGNTDGNQYMANLDGGYDFKINDHITVGPLVGLQYVHLDVDSFNEFGAGAANLAVGSQDVDSLRSRLGFRADYHAQLCKEVAFATEVHAEWQHEFLDDSRSISSAFVGSGLGSFNVQTTNPQRDAAVAGVGVNFTVRDRMTLFFDYDVQAGQDSYLENSVKGGLKISF